MKPVRTAWPKEKDVEYSPHMRGRYWAIVVRVIFADGSTAPSYN